MIKFLLIGHIVSLLLTILIEIPVAVLWGIRDRRELLIIALVQVITNPVAVLISNCFYRYTDLNLYVFQIPIEIAVPVAEWLLYKSAIPTFKHPFLLSFTANPMSYGTGLILSSTNFWHYIYSLAS